MNFNLYIGICMLQKMEKLNYTCIQKIKRIITTKNSKFNNVYIYFFNY